MREGSDKARREHRQGEESDKARREHCQGEEADEARREPRRDEDEEGRQAPERCGPLLVERQRKDDGRALIFYRRAREQDRGAEGEHDDRASGEAAAGGSDG